MVANLPKKTCPRKTSERDSDSTGDDDTVRKSPKKKKGRKGGKIQQTVPNVVVQSSDVQVRKLLSIVKIRSLVNTDVCNRSTGDCEQTRTFQSTDTEDRYKFETIDRQE